MAQPQVPGELYDLGRRAGLTHETAEGVERVVTTQSPRPPLSGYWPPMPSDVPAEDTGYVGPAPTTDSLLWLRKCGMALYCGPIVRYFVTQRLPMVVNVRARAIAWSRDGHLQLDLKLRHYAGELGAALVEYKTVRVPIAACIAHDTKHVLGLVLRHIGDPSVQMVEQTILNETDLRHVSG